MRPAVTARLLRSRGCGDAGNAQLHAWARFLAQHRVTTMSTIEVKVPDIGDFKDVPVIEVLVKAGDQVKAEDALITLESDKATMDVPAPAAGTIRELKVKVGDKLSEGNVILTLESSSAEAPKAAAAPARSAPSTPASGAPPAPA